MDLALGLLCLVELSVDVALGDFFDHVKQCVFGSFLLSGGLLQWNHLLQLLPFLGSDAKDASTLLFFHAWDRRHGCQTPKPRDWHTKRINKTLKHQRNQQTRACSMVTQW